jgi:hypothetical protein
MAKAQLELKVQREDKDNLKERIKIRRKKIKNSEWWKA